MELGASAMGKDSPIVKPASRAIHGLFSKKVVEDAAKTATAAIGKT